MVATSLVTAGSPRKIWKGTSTLPGAETLARALDDRVLLVRVLALKVNTLNMMGDPDGAIATGRQALELAAALGDSALQEQASPNLGQIYYFLGDFGRAYPGVAVSLEVANRMTDFAREPVESGAVDGGASGLK